MKDIFIVDALRTPFGSFGGSLSEVAAPNLASQVISTLLERHSVSGDQIDEVILGQVLQGGSGQAPARQAMRLAGLPDSVPAMTINKVCGSGLKAMMLAADSIQLGNSSMVLSGGMENMSLAPYLLPKARFGQRMGNGEILDLMIHDGLQDPYSNRHMGAITEEWIAQHGISREEQDDFAARSYRLAQSALDSLIFADELVPVVKKSRKDEVRIDSDEEPFRGDIDKLTTLRPVFNKEGTITAGNASTINDGASIALLADAESVNKYSLQPKARLATTLIREMRARDSRYGLATLCIGGGEAVAAIFERV